MTVVIKGLQKREVIGLKASYRENVTVLPAQHGDLIDIDKVWLNDFEIILCEGNAITFAKMLVDKISNAPVIVEAEVSE